MKVSVVMTTYNGEKYLREQLDSIREQTKKPDEVLIFDDCSIDRTVNLLNEYITCYSLDNWHVIVNQKNKGWKRNFIDGVENASGDVVFLSDQDDIWNPKKIELMYNVLIENQDALLVVCDYTRFTDTDGIKLEKVDEVYKPTKKKIESKPSNNAISYPGCTFCFKRSMYNQIRRYWLEDFPHDAFIYMYAWMGNGIYCCKEVLHYFRRHAQSATNSKGHLLDRERRCKYICDDLEQYLLFSNAGLLQLNNYAEQYKEYLIMRIKLLREPSFINCLKMLKFLSFYQSKKTYFADIYSAIFT